MTIIERMNLLLNKSKCIKVIITDTNKRVKIHIIKIEDNNMFNIGERTFTINYDAVFISNGIPTYFYYIDNPNTISVRELKKCLQPLDPELASQNIEISSSNLYTAIEETIARKIIRYAEDGDKKIINTIIMMGVMNIFAVLGIGYFLFINIEKILNFIIENESLIRAIRDSLINNAGQ